MKIIRDEKTLAINEIVFEESELDSKTELLSEFSKIELARIQQLETSSNNNKEVQLDSNKRQFESQMDYNKKHYDSQMDYNRRSQQIAYLMQYPGCSGVLPDWLR